ncbi:MAG: serine/threonine-protein phosphatase [Bacteroidales bacterium]|nr:serine/threonine-protein phosphatase [Bacteroidales bacterium]
MSLGKQIFILFCAVVAFAGCSREETVPEGQFSPAYLRGKALGSKGKFVEAKQVADSLRSSDTPLADAWADAALATICCYSDEEDSCVIYSQRARSVFSKLGSEYRGIVSELELFEAFCRISFSPDTALSLLEDCAKTFEADGDVPYLVMSNLYQSEIYKNKGDFVRGLSHLSLINDICDTITIVNTSYSWIIGVLGDIVNMASEMGDHRLANATLQQATLYFDRSDDYNRSYYLYNRAKSHLLQGEYILAANTAQRMEPYAERGEYWEYLADGYVIRGLALCRSGEYESARVYAQKADSISRQYKLHLKKENVLLEGELELVYGSMERARFLLFDSVRFDYRQFSRHCMFESQKAYYKAIGDYKSIYNVLVGQDLYMDSLQANVIMVNENTKLERSKFGMESVMQELEGYRSRIKELDRTSHIKTIVIISILIAFCIAILAYFRMMVVKYRTKLELEQTKLQQALDDKIIELRNQEAMSDRVTRSLQDSIAYAEHIQRSILPRPEELEMCDITGSFIFYSPLEIVSGDFYWFNQIGDHLIVCCADCTGHGIPGAFMSMIASTIISDICEQFGENIRPSELLERLDHMLVEELGRNQSEEGAAKDGCDISVASINVKTKSVLISSARRPVIVFKNQDIVEIPGTKRSIGDREPKLVERKFVDTELQLHTGDTIYMFSDGYSDQFGGQNNDRINIKNIKRFLRAAHNDDMDEQCLTMQDFFTQWKGDNPQTDDVLFMGLMI